MDLERPYRGTRIPAGSGFDVETRARLLLSTQWPGAFVCGPTAAALHGMPLPRRIQPVSAERIDLAVPAPKRAPRIPGVRGRALRCTDAEVDDRLGFRVTTPERTWCDLASDLDRVGLIAAGDRLLARADPMTSTEDLAAQVRRFARRRGHRTLAELLPLLDGASESPKESELRLWLMDHEYPVHLANVDIRDGADRFVARVDLYSPTYGTVLEYQGDQHRSERAQWLRDEQRIADLEALGYAVIRVNAEDLRQPARLHRRLELHLRRRGWVPSREPS